MEDIVLYNFKDDGSIPNNPDLPLVLYEGKLADLESDPPAVRRMLAGNGWSGSWVNGIYSYHHYHSTAHEVLAVTRGNAQVRFGGEEGKNVQVHAGDLVVIPAGTGHKNLGSSPDFQVVGAYPGGQTWDLCTGKPGERPGVLENIRSVPLPEADPVTGTEKPLLGYWKKARG